MLKKIDLVNGATYRLFAIQDNVAFELKGEWIENEDRFNFHDPIAKINGFAKFEDFKQVLAMQ